MALEVVDRAMQAFGAEGISQDQVLASTWAGLRTLRIADVRDCYSPLERTFKEGTFIGTRRCEWYLPTI